MMKRVGLWVAVLMLMSAVASWALSEQDQESMDRLQADLAFSLMHGEPALWTLFSTQGSAALMATEEGFVGATRGRLRSDEELAAQFRLPDGLCLGSENLQRSGEFIMGRLRMVAPPPLVPAAERPVRPTRDLWSAFMRPEEQFHVRRGAPRKDEAPDLPPEMLEFDVTLAAIQDGPGRTWRLVSLTVTPASEPLTAEESEGALLTIRSWEHAFMQGDITVLSGQLHPDPFCVAAHTPDGQSWFFTYPEYLTTMLAGALSMGTAERSEMLNLDPRISGQIATATGRWRVDVPMFGAMVWDLAASMVQADGQWKLVSLCAGLVEGF